MKWNFSGKQNVYLEIAQRYREFISAGALSPGDKLPSVRAAAMEMGVNPNTVARAFALLEEEGLVHTIPKKGIYVSDVCREMTNTEDEKQLLLSLREKGVSKETLLNLIKEVYD